MQLTDNVYEIAILFNTCLVKLSSQGNQGKGIDKHYDML